VKILLDSVILIDHFNGITAATAYLRQTRGDAVISVVTRAQVMTGFDEAAREETMLLDSYQLLEISKPIAALAAHLRREHRWKLPDAFQAALARHHDLCLATRNTRDFPPETHGFATVPYTI
jgi:predicted nucleic acid-binding protein